MNRLTQRHHWLAQAFGLGLVLILTLPAHASIAKKKKSLETYSATEEDGGAVATDESVADSNPAEILPGSQVTVPDPAEAPEASPSRARHLSSSRSGSRLKKRLAMRNPHGRHASTAATAATQESSDSLTLGDAPSGEIRPEPGNRRDALDFGHPAPESASNGNYSVPSERPVELTAPMPRAISAPSLQGNGGFDPVPAEQAEPIVRRLKLVEELIVKYGRAYDYRVHTVRELESILNQLEGRSASRARDLPPPDLDANPDPS